MVLPRGAPTVDVYDEGTFVDVASAFNFTGAGVTATYDAANLRFVITIPGTAAHDILSATHSDTFAADAPADLDLLTWIDAESRWEARPASAHGTHGVTVEHALVMGLVGTVPAATATDQAAFYVVVPFAMTLTRLKATLVTAPGADTTIQVRRSTDSGATFANAFGTVTISSGGYLGTSNPDDLAVAEGDILNFSITAGNGSGADLAVFVIGTAT